MIHLKFSNTTNQDFYKVVHARVNEYFEQTKQSKTANSYMIFKTVVTLSMIFGAYFSMLFLDINILTMFILWAIIGASSASGGFNIGHDAIHGSYSKNKLINTILGLSFNIIGANDYLWKIMHNQAHHTYTNVANYDEDIESVAGLRLCPTHEHKKIHRYQHIYAFFLYSLGSISWVLLKDFKKIRQKNIGGISTEHHSTYVYIRLIAFKLLYYFNFIAIPIIVLDFSWWIVVLGFIFSHLIEGFILAIIFMLAHVMEDAEFPEPSKNGIINDSWATHQMKTTVDFAQNNWLINFFCGGLNFQIEHHLFPNICHVYYKSIAPIVKQTAEEFKIPYNNVPTFSQAVKSHYNLLKKLGESA